MRSQRLLFALVSWWAVSTPCLADVRYIDPDEKTKTSLAVVVGDVHLIHTPPVLPVDRKNEVIGKEPSEQIGYVLNNLLLDLLPRVGTVRDLVKLNFYVARTSVVDDVKKELAKRLTGVSKPAVTFVVGKLPQADALVAVDAIAVIDRKPGDWIAVAPWSNMSLPRNRSQLA